MDRKWIDKPVALMAIAILVTTSVLAACMPVQPVAEVQAQPAEVDMETVVNNIYTEYSEAVNAGDVERWLALWTEDGVQMPPGLPALEGKEKIRTRRTAGAEAYDYDMSITNLEYEVFGDWTFARGLYQSTMTPKAGGDTVEIDGKYMSILQKQPDGSWKLYRDLFNSNVP